MSLWNISLHMTAIHYMSCISGLGRHENGIGVTMQSDYELRAQVRWFSLCTQSVLNTQLSLFSLSVKAVVKSLGEVISFLSHNVCLGGYTAHGSSLNGSALKDEDQA